eukprot:222420_1
MKNALNEQKQKMDKELLKLKELRIELEIEKKELKEQELSNNNNDLNNSYDKIMECAVKYWLKHTVRLSQYVDNFLLNGFDDINVIQETMNINDLSQIGIKKLGHRKKIMLHIDKLNSQNNDDPHMF